MQLKPIDRTDKGVRRLSAALAIYRTTILPEAQNPERQILYWIDHSKDNLVDEFRCFALVDAGEVVGYLQYSYFSEEHIFFFEYLCIRQERAVGMVPSPALDIIRQYLTDNYRSDFTIVFEIAQKRGTSGIWVQDKKLIRYFKRMGFRTIDFDYHYPVLQSYDGDLSYPADLMVGLPNHETKIGASQMRTVLRCLYFKHYLRWDRPFLDSDQFSQREQLINELYSKEVARIRGDDPFDTKGDPDRDFLRRFLAQRPSIARLLEKIFAPKLPRIIVTMAILLFLQWALGSVLFLIPFVLAVSAVYCLAEDSETSQKLFQAILHRLSPGRLR